MNVGLNNLINKASNLSFSSKATIPLCCFIDSAQDVFVKSAQKAKEISDTAKAQSQVPEFLYHLTNLKNLDKIAELGEIKPSKEIIDGVFMFDMNDFQKNWLDYKQKNVPHSLSVSLLLQALKTSDGLALLKIPTSELDKKAIRIRLQEEVCDFLHSDKYRRLCMAYAESGGPFQYKYEFPKELVDGYDVSKINEYLNDGRPVEYVYKKPIKITPQIMENALKIPKINYGSLLSAKEDEIGAIFGAFGDLALK